MRRENENENYKSEIEGTNDEKYVHLTFRPSFKDIFGIISHNPHLELIQIPKSHCKLISKNVLRFLEVQGIAFFGVNVWGHRSDIDDYIKVPKDEILMLHDKGHSVKEIERATLADKRMVEFVLMGLE